MKNTISALVSLTLLGSLLVGCGNAVETSPAQAKASDVHVRDDRAGDHEYVFSAGSAQVAHIVRSVRDDGSETLSSVSNLAHGTLKEYAELSANGRLVYADVSFAPENAMERRVLVDATRGAFYVQDERGASWHRMTTDAPWVLAGLTDEGDAFTLAHTPVSAWIAARAAKSAPSLRLIDAKLRQSVVTMADQLVVDDNAGERFVVTSSGAVSTNDEFVTSLGHGITATPKHDAIAPIRPRRTAQR